MTVLDVYNILVKARLQVSMPKLVMACVLFMTLSMTVATAERSFSKLKIIKRGYLQFNMSQECLDGLAIISIEHECAKNMDFEQLIKYFTMTLSMTVATAERSFSKLKIIKRGYLQFNMSQECASKI